jgi:hypothetical protein
MVPIADAMGSYLRCRVPRRVGCSGQLRKKPVNHRDSMTYLPLLGLRSDKT